LHDEHLINIVLLWFYGVKSAITADLAGVSDRRRLRTASDARLPSDKHCGFERSTIRRMEGVRRENIAGRRFRPAMQARVQIYAKYQPCSDVMFCEKTHAVRHGQICSSSSTRIGPGARSKSPTAAIDFAVACGNSCPFTLLRRNASVSCWICPSTRPLDLPQ
jgi:hypothetical protein